MFNFKSKYGGKFGAEDVELINDDGMKEKFLVIVLVSGLSAAAITLDSVERNEIVQGLLKLECEAFNCSDVELLTQAIEKKLGNIIHDYCRGVTELKKELNPDKLFDLAMQLLTLSIRKREG